MTNNYSKELEIAKSIAFKAGVTMLKYFDGDQQVETKDDGSPVTIADKMINTIVIYELKKHFPDDGIIGEEESTTDYGLGRKWICDPIDGTIAFTWGTPTSMFSLALVIDGKPVLGVVYDPFLNNLYHGIKGLGSFCNDKPISVSSSGLDYGRVALTSDARKLSEGLDFVKRLSKTKAYFAVFSGAVYKATLVAKGKFVGYIEEGVKAHDVAAVQVLVEEAGGKVTSLSGKNFEYTAPFKGAIISNGLVHNELVDIYNQ